MEYIPFYQFSSKYSPILSGIILTSPLHQQGKSFSIPENPKAKNQHQIQKATINSKLHVKIEQIIVRYEYYFTSMRNHLQNSNNNQIHHIANGMKQQISEEQVVLKDISCEEDDFKQMIEKNLYYVDKTLFIKELMESEDKTTLIVRPRRFGKTLMLSMLQYFFENTNNSNQHLFSKLEIENGQQNWIIETFKNKHPVIYLNFKSCQGETWDECKIQIKAQIADEFKRHQTELNQIEDKYEQKIIEDIMKKEPTANYQNALKYLTKYLSIDGKQPFVLIDEYDAPCQSGFKFKYYESVILFMKLFLGEGLKSNSAHFCKAVITGILHISQQDFFSAINPRVNTVLDERYADKYGFILKDVTDLLQYYNISEEKAPINKIIEWYGGYNIGTNIMLFNPYSIVSFIHEWRSHINIENNFKANLQQNFNPFSIRWIKTGDPALLNTLIQQADDNTQIDIANLLVGRVQKLIATHFVMNDLAKFQSQTFWTLLLYSGFVTWNIVPQNPELSDHKGTEFQDNPDLKYRESKQIYMMKIPNKEARDWLEECFDNICKEKMPTYGKMMNMLRNKKIDEFNSELQKNLDVVNVLDISKGKTGIPLEKAYHMFMLGMCVTLNDTHIPRSNQFSGLGRYDVCLIPRNNQSTGFILEFKVLAYNAKNKIGEAKKTTLIQNIGYEALKQIDDLEYDRDLKKEKVTDIVKWALVFYDLKSVKVFSKDNIDKK